MKKPSIIFIFLLSLQFSCSDGIGNLDFEKIQEEEFTQVLPNIGTFNFKQKINVEIKPNKVTTFLKVTTTNEEKQLLFPEIIGFKSSSWSYDNIIFIYGDTLKVNSENFKMIDTEGSIKLKKENLFISVFEYPNSSHISGRYEGVGKIFSKSNDSLKLENLFRVFGNIDISNEIIILPLKKDEAEFDFLIGNYSVDGDFNGRTYKDSTIIGTLNNSSSEPFQLQDFKQLNDTLNLTINNIEKKIFINIEKINP